MYKHLLAITLFTVMTTFSSEQKNENGRVSPVCATTLQKLLAHMSTPNNSGTEHRDQMWAQEITKGTANDDACRNMSFWIPKASNSQKKSKHQS